jgi:triacylglycerol lipase
LTRRARVVLIPGMFGFGKLAGYDYFAHVERHLSAHFRDAGVELEMAVVTTPPTASIRRRARAIAAELASRGAIAEDVHIIGHSTGGLDARLVASPSVDLGIPGDSLAWRANLKSVLTINTPHHGTPIATFFTSVSGVRLLYALSLLTFTTLRFGGPPLTVLSSLVAALGSVDEAFGVDIRLLDRATDMMLRFVGTQGRGEVKDWLDGIRRDQGGIVQVTPEAMDLFNATAADAAGVRYGFVASAAPPPSPLRLWAKVRSPVAAFSATIYSTLFALASREHDHYPPPAPSAELQRKLDDQCRRTVDSTSNDGVVPTLSMPWGELVWAGAADHLDIVGHFRDDEKPTLHTDWLYSASGLSRARFADLMRSVARFLLRDEAPGARSRS